MPISSLRTITYLQKTFLISFKTSFYNSSKFESLPIYFNIFLPRNPTLSRGIRVGQLHLVCIFIQSWIDSIYSPTIYNWPWYHPVGWIHPVYFWVNYTLLHPMFIWTWSHPVTLNFLKLHMKINTRQKFHMRSYYLSIDYS